MVPHAVREAALGLGVPNWRSVLSITVKTASPGIITGCMLAFARVAGETAPLIFTALGNSFWSTDPNRPIEALPLQIYVYARALRRSAPAGVGGVAGVDCVDCDCGVAGALCDQPRSFERGKLGGRRHRGDQPECVVRNQPHTAGHQSEYSGQSCHCVDWSVGLRQRARLCAA